MTDGEAREFLDHLERYCSVRGAFKDAEAVRHALQAMDDLEQILLQWFHTGHVTEVTLVPLPVPIIEVMHTALRHRRGQK